MIKIITLKHFATNGNPFMKWQKRGWNKLFFSIFNKEKRILEDEHRYQYMNLRSNTLLGLPANKAYKCTARAVMKTKNGVKYLKSTMANYKRALLTEYMFGLKSWRDLRCQFCTSEL